MRGRDLTMAEARATQQRVIRLEYSDDEFYIIHPKPLSYGQFRRLSEEALEEARRKRESGEMTGAPGDEVVSFTSLVEKIEGYDDLDDIPMEIVSDVTNASIAFFMGNLREPSSSVIPTPSPTPPTS